MNTRESIARAYDRAARDYAADMWDEIKALAESLGYRVVDILIRYPYVDVEYPSKRAYFVVRNPS